jgi:para-nitrobenzyl esterase
LLQATLKNPEGFSAVVDGVFFPEDPRAIYAAGKQAHVPLLAGWNRDEASAQWFFGKDKPTAEAYKAKLHDQL